jgi:hypothetical protein
VYGKNQQKQLRKSVKAKPTAEAIKAATGVDEQIADVRHGNLEDNAIHHRTLSSGPNNADRAVTGEHVQEPAITDDHLVNEYSYFGHSHDGEGWTDNHNHTGQNWFDNHSHSSSPFMQYTDEEREQILMERAELEALLLDGSLTYFERLIAKNTLNSLKLQMDYIAFDAYERERRFRDPEWAQWSEMYKAAFRVGGQSPGDEPPPVHKDQRQGIVLTRAEDYHEH